jgi:hypothetical protein
MDVKAVCADGWIDSAFCVFPIGTIQLDGINKGHLSIEKIAKPFIKS